ncbi:preprotein translocase subunit YajC [Streptacidiphilus sp. ASG 303]|nr:preprotein translocase subunit YajC [Streptacidiphilus sp. ASG 303]
MVLMTRNAKKKQQQALEMRNTMGPGSGVRTIGGMYATVKSVNDDTVELEAAPGVFLHFTKSAIAAVLEPEEYAAIIHGVPASDDVPPFVEDDAAAVTADLTKPAAADLSKPAAAPAADAPEGTADAPKSGPAAEGEGPAAAK